MAGNAGNAADLKGPSAPHGLFFVITKYKVHQASCITSYFAVSGYTLGGYKYGKWVPTMRNRIKGLFREGSLLHPGHRLEGAQKLYRRPETRLVDLKAYLKSLGGEVQMNTKRRVGLRPNLSEQQRARALQSK
jgi:hypothetical protein